MRAVRFSKRNYDEEFYRIKPSKQEHYPFMHERSWHLRCCS